MRSSPAARSSARASRRNSREVFLRVLGPESEIGFPTLNTAVFWSLCVCGVTVSSVWAPLWSYSQSHFHQQNSRDLTWLQSKIILRLITFREKSTAFISTQKLSYKTIALCYRASFGRFWWEKVQMSSGFLAGHMCPAKEGFPPKS